MSSTPKCSHSRSITFTMKIAPESTWSISRNSTPSGKTEGEISSIKNLRYSTISPSVHPEPPPKIRKIPVPQASHIFFSKSLTTIPSPKSITCVSRPKKKIKLQITKKIKIKPSKISRLSIMTSVSCSMTWVNFQTYRLLTNSKAHAFQVCTTLRNLKSTTPQKLPPTITVKATPILTVL